MLDRRNALRAGLLIALGGGGRSATAQAEPKEDASAAQRLKEYREAAARYVIETNDEPPVRLVLQAEPVLRWSNPLRQTEDGAVFLWLANGRPAAIASFYRYRFEGVLSEDHEFQSLARVGLTARVADQVVWFPRAAGVTLKPVPDAPVPAATPAARLRQMRALAREFRASFNLTKDKSDLRLLNQPLYRYESKPSEVGDGALFAFVQTTDPEVLLLIESRPAGGALVWHYGFARMSMVDLIARHKEREVWTAAWDDDRHNPGKPYVTIGAAPLPR